VKPAVLTLRFASELAMLGALAWWGADAGRSVPADVALGIGAPLAAIAVWGRFVAPKSETRLEDPMRLVVEVVLFDIAAAALALAYDWRAALGFLAAAIGLAALTRVVGEEVAGR
jgi:hypothetical protein